LIRAHDLNVIYVTGPGHGGPGLVANTYLEGTPLCLLLTSRHDLRHTDASIMINEGANLKFVSKQLGHSSIQITLDRYSHLIPERHDASIEHFEQVVLGSRDVEDRATAHESPG
jgi:integrase